MKSIKTKDTNINYAADQNEYVTLPAFKTKDGQVISCWELTDDEVQKVIESKVIYLRQLTFNQALQPVMITVDNPVIHFSPLKQTRLRNNEQRGNCLATVIACMMQKGSPEDVIQIQEDYHREDWREILDNYLHNEGLKLKQLDGHLANGTFYFVTGESPRDADVTHVVIYQDGEMVHDPHPDNSGIKSTLFFEQLILIE